MIKQFFNNLISKLSLKAGFGLILAIFVIAAFTILGITGVNLLSTQTDEAITHLNKTKTFYLALAARDFALETRLSPWRTAFDYPVTQETHTLGDGQIRVDVPTFAGRTATLSYMGFLSTAHPLYGNFYIEMRQDFDSNPTTAQTLTNYQGLYSYSGAILLKDWGTCGASGIKHSTQLQGNVYFSATSLKFSDTFGSGYCRCCSRSGVRVGNTTSTNNNFYTNGPLTIATTFTAPDYGIHGNAYSGGSITGAAQISGTANQNQPAGTWPTIPTLTTTYYTNLINLATTYGFAGITYTANTNLNGQTVFVNGNVTINNSVSITSTPAPGYIIATGNIKVHNKAIIGERIYLIAGGQVTIDQGSSTPATIVGGAYQVGDLVNGVGALVYSGGQMNLFTFGVAPGYGLFKGYFLTPANVLTDWDANGKLFGIMYANSLAGSGCSSCFVCVACSDCDYCCTTYQTSSIFGNVIIKNNQSGNMTIADLHPYSQAGYSPPYDTYIPLNLPGLINPTYSVLRFQ
ncbi:MAG: hypothetical protein AB1629_03120 [Candidatus Omnitrophota bacterium]